MTVKSCEKLEKSRVALTIETSAEEFEAAVNKAYLKMRGKINVPGFRVGKAPRKIIEKMYGAEVFYEEAVNIILPDAYEAAVKEQELNVVGYPEVELESCTKDGVVFKCTVAIYPEVKLGQYKGLEAPKAEVKVAAADVNARLKEMADRNSRLVSVDRAVKKGDKIITIGGIVGKIVMVNPNTIVIETSDDRVRMELTKWAVSTTGVAGPDPEFLGLMPDYLAGITLRGLAVICADLDGKRQTFLLEAEHVAPHRVPLDLTVASVDRFTMAHQTCTFRELLDGDATTEQLVVTFLAMLELAKRGSLTLSQDEIFGTIQINRVEGAEAYVPGEGPELTE